MDSMHHKEFGLKGKKPIPSTIDAFLEGLTSIVSFADFFSANESSHEDGDRIQDINSEIAEDYRAMIEDSFSAGERSSAVIRKKTPA